MDDRLGALDTVDESRRTTRWRRVLQRQRNARHTTQELEAALLTLVALLVVAPTTGRLRPAC